MREHLLLRARRIHVDASSVVAAGIKPAALPFFVYGCCTKLVLVRPAPGDQAMAADPIESLRKLRGELVERRRQLTEDGRAEELKAVQEMIEAADRAIADEETLRVSTGFDKLLNTPSQG